MSDGGEPSGLFENSSVYKYYIRKDYLVGQTLPCSVEEVPRVVLGTTESIGFRRHSAGKTGRGLTAYCEV